MLAGHVPPAPRVQNMLGMRVAASRRPPASRKRPWAPGGRSFAPWPAEPWATEATRASRRSADVQNTEEGARRPDVGSASGDWAQRSCRAVDPPSARRTSLRAWQLQPYPASFDRASLLICCSTARGNSGGRLTMPPRPPRMSGGLLHSALRSLRPAALEDSPTRGRQQHARSAAAPRALAARRHRRRRRRPDAAACAQGQQGQARPCSHQDRCPPPRSPAGGCHHFGTGPAGRRRTRRLRTVDHPRASSGPGRRRRRGPESRSSGGGSSGGGRAGTACREQQRPA